MSHSTIRPDQEWFHSIELIRYYIDDIEHRNEFIKDQPVLKDLSLTFPAGKVTALVGSSGGGKSSIVSLLCRLYERVSGEILVDGVDIKHFSHKALHR